MSLRDEFNADDGTKHDFGSADPMADFVVNLAALEVPVGTLKLKDGDISVDGKSLSELYESAKRAKDTPTVFNVGGEDFDIHYRRYNNGEAMEPQKAAEDILTLVAEIINSVPLMERINRCSGQNFNHNLSDHQVIGTLLIGVFNTFYRGAGVMLRVNKHTLNPAGLFAINKEIATGAVSAERSENFETLNTVEEIDSVTSIAMDVFTGRVYGTAGLNGLVVGQVKLLSSHYVGLINGILDSIDDSMALSAFISVLSEPKWANDSLGLSVYLNAIDFHSKVETFKSNLIKRLGGVSLDLIRTFVDMSLVNVDYEGGSFAGGVAKRFLTTSASMFNEMMSKYTIVLASAINSEYPLIGTIRDKARFVMTEYSRHRIHYDSMISGNTMTPEYAKTRMENRVLHTTLFKYWKEDTAHSRLLRTAMGSNRSRYQGSIEIVLSTSEDMINSFAMGTSLNFTDDYVVPTPPTEEETSPTDSTNPIKENEMSTTSILTKSRNGAKAIVLREGEMVETFGPVDIIKINDTKTLLLLGMSSVMATKTSDGAILTEPSSETKIGEMVGQTVKFDNTPLGLHYGTLAKRGKYHTANTENGGVVLTNNESEGMTFVTTAASGLLPYESKDVVRNVINEAIRSGNVTRFNNVWYKTPLEMVIADPNKVLIVEGVEVGIAGVSRDVYPASYFTVHGGPLNWLAMMTNSDVKFHLADEVLLAPSPLLTLQRITPEGAFNPDQVSMMTVANYPVTVVTTELINQLDRVSLDVVIGDEVDLNTIHEVGVFGYVDNDGVPHLYVGRLREKSPTDGQGIDDLKEFAPEVTPASALEDAFINAMVPEDDSGFDINSGSMMDELGDLNDENDMFIQTSSPSQLPDDVPVANDVDWGDMTEDHYIDMESLLDEAIESTEADVSADDTEVVTEAVATDVDETTAEVEEIIIPIDTLPEVIATDTHLISYYGRHENVLFVSEEELAEKRDQYQSTPSIRDNKTEALNRYIELPEGITLDAVLAQFADDAMGEINYTEKQIDNTLCLEVDSMDETAHLFIDLARRLGTSALGGLDTVSRVGHRWIVTTRYNALMNSAIIHIVDAYDTIEYVDVDTVIDDEDIVTVNDAMEASDEWNGDEFPALVKDISFIPKGRVSLDAVSENAILNSIRKARAKVKDAEKNSLITVIEILSDLADTRATPRRLTRTIIGDVVAKVIDITAKHYPLSYGNATGGNRDELATYINRAYQDIASAFGVEAADCYFYEIESIDILDQVIADVIVVDMDSGDLGLSHDLANVPADSLAIDLSLFQGCYVLTSDNTLLRYNSDELILRPNLSRVTR